MSASDARMGIARLLLPDGQEVALRFTWSRIDAVGRDWIVDRLQTAITGKAGCQGALAELLVLASGGLLAASDLLSDGREPVPYEAAFKAVEDAWILARFGPARKADGQPGNPQKSRQTWWKRIWRRQSAPD